MPPLHSLIAFALASLAAVCGLEIGENQFSPVLHSRCGGEHA
ncbi:MAG: hypothetical protein ACYC06_03070 [Ilumatobacteraceae bacterium]